MRNDLHHGQQSLDVAGDSPTERLKRITPEEAFDGKTYDPPKDFERLGQQLRRVWLAMSDGQWWTLSRLHDVTGDPEASISARIRDLRKKRFGGFMVETKRHPQVRGLFIYRLVPPA